MKDLKKDCIAQVQEAQHKHDLYSSLESTQDLIAATAAHEALVTTIQDVQ